MPRLIGYHGYVKDGKGFLVNHEGGVCTEPPFFDWLLNAFTDAEDEGHRNIAYDIDDFVAVVCRLADFTAEEAETLIDKGKLHIPPYDLQYYAAKYFSIKKGAGWGRPYFAVYDAGQYIEGPSLEDNPTVEYAVERAMEAREAGALASKTFYQLGWDGSTLTSPIRSLEKSMLKGQNWPTHKDIPPEVNELALKCCHGPWVEAFQVGYWPKAYDYDLVSCYPYMMSRLLDVRRGDWVLSPTKPEGAVYGFVEGEVTITEPFSPILYGHGENEEDYTYTPTGTRPTQITSDAIDFIREFKQGEFKEDKGWWWIPNGGVQYEPVKGIITWLYQKRAGATPFENKQIKRAMAALWGRTLSEYRDGYGPQFNPVWAALVEERTRLEVARFVLENKLTPIHVAVDGVIAPELVELPKNGGMGSWRVSHTGSVLVLSSGIAAVEGKVGAEDFSLKYDWLKGMIENNPEASGYEMKKYSVCTMAKALATEFSRLGEVEEVVKRVEVGVDGKRLYWETPKTGADLIANQYESEPMDVSVIIGQGA